MAGGGGGGGGGGGRGGGGRGGGRGNQNARRGPYNGQFANFGNRRRTQPPYTGSLSLTEQNSALNAAPFSLNGLPSQKPYSSSNNFTATVGGPMVIPKLLNWQRANFNFSYRGSLNLNGSNMLGTVPTDAERLGDFSGVKSIIYDPLNGAPFAGNIIPQSRIDPAAQTLLQYFPHPTYDNVVQNYRLITTAPNWSQTIGVRLSAPINNKDRTNFNVQYQDRNSKSKQLFGYTDLSDGYGLSASAGWSHSFAPRFNNTANLTFSRNITEGTPFFAYGENIAAAGRDYRDGTGPDQLRSADTLLHQLLGPERQRSLGQPQPDDELHRQHHVRGAAQTQPHLRLRLQTTAAEQPELRERARLVQLQRSAHQRVECAGPAGGRDRLRLRRLSAGRSAIELAAFRQREQLFPQLGHVLVRAGRLAATARPHDQHRAALRIFRPVHRTARPSGESGCEPWFHGRCGGDSRGDWALLGPCPHQPRAFHAEQLLAAHRCRLAALEEEKPDYPHRLQHFLQRLAVRVDREQHGAQPPFAKTASISTSLLDPLTLENGFATSPNQTTNTFGVNPDYQIAYAQTWNFTIQNTLPHGWVIETEYIGTKGTNLAINEQPNRVLAGTSVATQQLQIANTTGFSYLTSGANSIFNAGQVRMTRRFTRGISSTILYTFSKSIDDASSFNGTGGTVVQYLDNLGLERGLSTFDQRHNLQTTFLFSSPVGVRGMLRNGGWKTAALAGWTLSGTFAATSGTPLTAYVSGNLANTGGLAAFGNLRAEATGLPVDRRKLLQPGGVHHACAGRVRRCGPGHHSRIVPSLSERVVEPCVPLRRIAAPAATAINANNVLNHVTITSVGTTVNSATYGLPTGASATRTVSVLLRFNF